MCLPGLVNLSFGWKLNQNYTNLHLVYAFYGVLCGVYLILEFRHRFGHFFKFCECKLKSIKVNRESRIFNDGQELSLDLISKTGSTHAEILSEILAKNRNWVFMDEFILDISGFISNHPGGSFMLNKVQGEDVGKYINGCSSIGNGISPYTHSQMAKNIMKYLLIGSIHFNNDVLIKKNDDAMYENMEWEIVRKYKVSDSTWCIEMKSADFDVRENPKGFEWFGKHFRVQTKVNGRLVTRYYSFSSVNLKT